MKFRSIPKIIEAEQWFEGRVIEGVLKNPDEDAHVHTIHSDQAIMLNPGDWIISEGDGTHFYPCKADIFKRTYEPIE